ncbi:MAG: hypothetical protein ABIF17_00085 [Patescibacteria group bacterium]
MKKKDYNQHHSHKTLEHQVETKRSKKHFTAMGWFFLILAIIFLFLFLIFYTGLLKIKTIITSGTLNSGLISSIEKNIHDYLDQNFYGNNILFLSKDKLKRYILNNIKLEKLEINKKFPNKLEVEITQEIPAVLWDENHEYFLINKQGIVDTQINLSQLQWELPKVSLATSTMVLVGQKLIADNFLLFIPEFDKEFRQANLNIKINKYIIQDFEGREVRTYTDNGWYIILNTDNNIKIIIDNLKILMEQKFKEDAPREYIDLRLEDKIFYK